MYVYCIGGGARNAKISDNKEERRKTWNPQTSVFNKYMEILTTEEETNWNQLALVSYMHSTFTSAKIQYFLFFCINNTNKLELKGGTPFRYTKVS